MLSKTKISLGANAAADITQLVRDSVKGAQQGICLVSLPDPYAGIIVTDGRDPRRIDDLLSDMERAFPARESYESGDPIQTAAAVKSALFGTGRGFPVVDGALVLGENQSIFAVSYGQARETELVIRVLC